MIRTLLALPLVVMANAEPQTKCVQTITVLRSFVNSLTAAQREEAKTRLAQRRICIRIVED